jgi:hypothetical protein
LARLDFTLKKDISENRKRITPDIQAGDEKKTPREALTSFTVMTIT